MTKAFSSEVASGSREENASSEQRIQDGQLRRCAASNSPGPPAPERIQWVEARVRAFSFTLAAGLPLLEAARRGFADAALFRRRAEYARRAARAVCLCDAGAVEDRRQCGVLQRHVSALRHHAAEARRDDARRARWRAVLSLPRVMDRDRRTSARRPHSARGEHRRRYPFAVEAFGIDGAMFLAEPDPENDLKLFGPCCARRHGCQGGRAAPSRCGWRPNEDFAVGAGDFCRQRGILRARIFTAASAPPSAAHFSDGRTVVPFVILNLRSRPAPLRPALTARCRRSSTSRWSIISAASPRAG